MALTEEQRCGGHDAIPITVGFRHLLKGNIPKLLIPLNMEKESAGFEFSDVHVMFARLTVAATMAISSDGIGCFLFLFFLPSDSFTSFYIADIFFVFFSN